LSKMGNIHIKILDINKELIVDSSSNIHPFASVEVSISLGTNFFPRFYNDMPNVEQSTEEEMEHAPAGEMEEVTKGTYITPVTGDRGILGYIELSDAPDFYRSAVPARNALLLAAVFAVALAVMLGLVMGNRISRPLRLLTDSVSKIREDNLHIRSEISSADEIGTLSRQFNLMAQRLEKSFTQMEKERDILKHFAADASHELRTPVTALTTFNELLSGPLGDDAESRIEYLGDCRVQIKRMEWIINNLLELSRYDGSLVDLKLDYCPIADIVDTALSSVISGINDKNVQIKKDFDGGSVRCDRQRVVQALVNLLSNAIKYSDKDGELTIAVKKEELGRNKEAVRFSVLDNGPGIAEDDIYNIFKRFYRSAPEEIPGSGLGLSLVESIARAHGGTVRARNRKSGGADVSFVINA
jgi:signal transduction histidine kinase